jgi:glycosyltransferase involved in cell wall biosynthesis
MNNHQLLIIGRIPPPIGGVTIHVQRLCAALENKSYPFLFCTLSVKNILIILKKILSAKMIHYHASNPYILFFFVLYCRITSKKILFTYHRNIEREMGIRKMVLHQSICLSSVPIVLNRESFKKVYILNKNAQLIPAFIPPNMSTQHLDHETEDRIVNFIKCYAIVFSSNASSFVLDADGKEIYGITELVKIFSTLSDKGLILSDSSSQYKKHLKEVFDHLPDNLLILDYPHNFVSVLIHTSAMIRATTTDGDSLSIKEALFLKKWVIASDCVSRPNDVILYKTGEQEDLSRAIKSILPNTEPILTDEIIDGSSMLINLYNKLLNN